MRRGIMIRLAALLTNVTAVIFFALAIPARYHELATYCSGLCAASQVSVGSGASGLPLAVYAFVLTALEAVSALLYVLASLGIFWRRANHPMAFFVAAMLIIWGTTFPPTMSALPAMNSAWFWPVALTRFIGAAALTLFFYIFPDGHFRPSWSVWLAVLWIASQIPRYAAPRSVLSPDAWPPILLAVVSAGFLGIMVALQVYRYRAASDVMQRRQTRWVVLGIGCALAGYAIVLLLVAISPPLARPGTVASLMVAAAEELCVALLPLSITAAIVRNRLFDVDRLINRTLVYGTLSALLAGMYFGSVVLLQQIARSFNGQRQDSTLVIILSTLLIAALFQPLRRRIQHTIDRRFYRAKYDATKTMDRFATTLRQQVELDQLKAHLVEVVQETVQPSSTWLWLAPWHGEKTTKPAGLPPSHAMISASGQQTAERNSISHEA